MGWGRSFGPNIPHDLTNAVAIAGAFDYDLVLRADGRVVALGSSDRGATDMPAGMTNVVAVAAGYTHGVALKSDGRVVCWGAYGNPAAAQIVTPPPELTNAMAIAAGLDLTLALTSEGRVVAWGADSGGLQVPTGLSNVVSIAAGENFGLAVRADGLVRGWGDGQLGQISIPSGLFPARQVAAGIRGHCSGVRRDGQLFSWGNSVFQPNDVPADLGPTLAVREGGLHTVALLENGLARAWGFNDQGQCDAPTGVRFLAVTAGQAHGAGLTRAPVLLDYPSPQAPPASQPATFRAFALCSDPFTYQWYFESRPILGATNSSLTIADPQVIDNGNYFVAATNEFGSTRSAEAWLWVSPAAPTIRASPSHVAIEAGQDARFSVVAAGSQPLGYQWQLEGVDILGATNATLVVPAAEGSAEGRYRVRVSNDYGSMLSGEAVLTTGRPVILGGPDDLLWPNAWKAQLSVDVLSPTDLTYQWYFNGVALPEAKAALLRPRLGPLESGEYFVAITNKFGSCTSRVVRLRSKTLPEPLSPPGLLAAWRHPAGFELTIPAELTNVVAVSGHQLHTLALRKDGSLVVWGDETVPGVPLGIPPGLSNVVGISSSEAHHLALHGDGSVTAFGPYLAPTGFKLSVTNAVGVSAGVSYALILRGDGTVTQWPEPESVPSSLTNIIAVSTSKDVHAALEANGTVWLWRPAQPWSLEAVMRGPPQAVAVAAGPWAVGVVRADGTVWDCRMDAEPRAVQLGGLDSAVAISAGFGGKIALRQDGTAIAQGESNLEPVPKELMGIVGVQVAGMRGLAITRAPVILRQPVSQTLQIGEPLVIQVEARSSTPLHCRWWQDGQTVNKDAQGSLKIPSVHHWDSGKYQLVLSNDYYSVTSAVAVVTVVGPPEVQPLPDLNVQAGGLASWTVDAAGPRPIRYQWYFNGLSIPGATNQSLMLTNLQASDQGHYSVSVADSDGTNTDGRAFLTVVPSLPSFVREPANAAVPEGSTWRGEVAAQGTEPISWRWFFQGNPIPGATGSNFEIASVSAADLGVYAVTASNSVGQVTSREFRLSAVDSPPVLADPLRHRVAREGGSISLTPRVVGSRPLSFQWARDGSSLPVSTESALAWPEVRREHAGDYWLVVSNQFGAASNGPIHLTVIPSRGAGTVVSWGTLPKLHGTTEVLALSVYQDKAIALRRNGQILVETTSPESPPPALSNVVDVSVGLFHCLALRDDGRVQAWGDNSWNQCDVPATLDDAIAVSAGDYHSLALKRDGTVVAWGRAESSLWAPVFPTNALATQVIKLWSSRSRAMVLRSDGSLLVWGAGNSSLSTIPAQATNVADGVLGPVFAVALRQDGTAVGWGSMVPTSATNLIAVGAGMSHGLGVRRDGSVMGWGSDSYRQLRVPSWLQAATAVTGGDTYSMALTRAPLVITNRVPRLVSYGIPAELAVEVVGPGPMTYQWSLNGSPLPSATNTTLLLASPKPSDAGNYQVRVTNPYAWATSSIAPLSVASMPRIWPQPENAAVALGASATFSARVTGEPPLSLQWMHNGASIAGANQPQWTIPSVSLWDAGYYQLVASNAAGTTSSRTVSLVPQGPDVPYQEWLGPVVSPDRSFNLLIFVSSNEACRVETSLDLKSWTTLSNAMPDLNFLFINEVMSPSVSNRFYRLVR